MPFMSALRRTPASRSLVALIAAVAVVGCATSPRPSLPPTVSSSDGVVAIRVVALQEIPFNEKWTTLSLADEMGHPVQLNDVAPSGAAYSLFAGPLPPGKYSIRGLQTDGAPIMTMGVLPYLISSAATRESESAGAQLGTFMVAPGAFTNLGVIATSMPEGKGGKLKVMLLADQVAKQAAFDSLDDAAKDRVRSLAVVGWDAAPPQGDEQARAVGLVRAHAANLSGLEVTDGGRLLIGTGLGFVHQRDAQGAWTTEWTGSLDTITCVKVLPDGAIFAGADTGAYFIRQAGQKAWKRFTLTQGERIAQLEPMGRAGYAVHTQSQFNFLGFALKNRVLFKRDLLVDEAAKELISVSGSTTYKQVPLFFDGKELLFQFNEHGILRTGALYRVDAATLKTTIERANHWMRAVYRLPDGKLARDRVNGRSAYSDFSDDNGRTWTEGGSTPSGARYVDRMVGYGVATVAVGWSTGTVGLSKTSNGGKDWERVGPPVEVTGNGRLQIRSAGDTVFFYTGMQLLSSADAGKTWAVAWPLSSE